MKTLLYAYRVYLTGIAALRTGAIESNLNQLNEEFRLAMVSDLIARKRAGQEKAPLAAGEATAHAAELDHLERELERAHEQSKLPEVATTVAELNDFVVRVRLERMAKLP